MTFNNLPVKKNPSSFHSKSYDNAVASIQNKRLKIFTQFFPPDFAPTGQLIDELTYNLAQRQIRVSVFTGQPGYAFRATEAAPQKENRNQVFVKRSRTAQIWPQKIRGKAINGLLFFIRSALHILKSHYKYDVILLTTAPPFLPVLGYLSSIFLKKSYICLIYDLYPDIAIQLGVINSSNLIAKFWKNVNYHVWDKASEIIVLSPAMKARVIKQCPKAKDKIVVIHSWADPEKIVPIAKHKNWFAMKHQLVDKFTVVYSGNMGRCHDMDTLLDAVIALKDEEIQFVFIGGGAKRQDFVAQVKKFSLNNCLFLPYQDKEVLPYSLTAGDLSLVSVSSGMEDFVAPSKLYSALSAGRPIAVVCPQSSYLNSLISDANCGITLNNGDSQGLVNFISYLQKDDKTARAMGRNAHQYLKNHFTPQLVSKKYFEVIDKALTDKFYRLERTKQRK